MTHKITFYNNTNLVFTNFIIKFFNSIQFETILIKKKQIYKKTNTIVDKKKQNVNRK